MGHGGDTADRAGKTFRDRARHEAARYGNDEWIFVRELLQNARDAKATRVDWTVAALGDDVVVSCRDDGEGMDLGHARRYLFSLYTSSKEGARNQIGCFGVGFWSILRFAPTTIVISSCPRGATPWSIELDGELRHARQRVASPMQGTKIVLVRPGRAEAVTEQIRRAARHNARYLSRRDAPEMALPIRVNGDLVNEPFELPAPSSQFRRGKLRGVVSLGRAPRVELLSGGLLVRSAVDLDEIENKDLPTKGTAPASLPGGTSPVVLLDSPSLELLLARRDARQTKSLRRLVRLARRELRWLVTRQIDRSRPPSLFQRLRGVMQHWLRDHPRRQFALALVLSLGSGWWVVDRFATSTIPTPQPDAVAVGTPTPSEPEYRDLSGHYYGPAVSPMSSSETPPPVDLRYHPANESKYLRMLALDHVDTGASPKITGTPYRSTPCVNDCTSIELRFRAAPGYMRIPVPSGERVDVQSVRFDGRATLVYRSPLDEPAIYLAEATRGVLSYVTAPASPVDVVTVDDTMDLPRDLERRATALSQRSIGERVANLRTLTRSRVTYRNDIATATAHGQARAAGQSFLTRTLAIGAGDCDVQNGLLVALLRAAGVPARLAIGYVGRQGRVNPALHAWVEYRAGDGPWLVADASETPIASTVGSDASNNIETTAATSTNTTTPAGPLHATPPSTATNSLRSTTPASAPASSSPISPASIASTDTDDPTPHDGHPNVNPTTSEPADARPTGQGRAQSGPNTPDLELDAVSSLATTTATTDAPTAAAWSWARRHAPAVAGTFGLVTLLGWRWRRRTRRDLTLDDGTDIAAMLTGALQRPELFRDLPAIMDRPLVPLLGRKAMSLRDAMDRAATRRLYCAATASDLTRRVDVVDIDTPEGAAVAETLAATDLDRWRRWLSHAQVTPIVERLAEMLRDQGERWLIKLGSALERPIEMLDLHEIGQRSHGYDRIVLVADDDPKVRALCEQWRHRPATAAFALADHVLMHLDLSDERRRQLLTTGAAAAVDEALT